MAGLKSQKLGLGALIALVIGSMIGGGIFSLPQNMALGAGAGAIIIGWIVTTVGMLCLAFIFQTLAIRRPELDSGVYAYAKAGFGEYMGFNSAWGYWVSAWVGNIGYFILLFSALGLFFPVFGQGNTLVAVACESVLLWILHWLILRGIREAADINLLTTIAKVTPIIIFIAMCFFAFRISIFTHDIWGIKTSSLGSVLHQVKSMMLVTVWVFLGIEGANVFSARAKKRSDVGVATIIGFLTVLAILVSVNVLSMGIMSQSELIALQNPSMAGVLERVIGRPGVWLVSIGLVFSLLGALLSWVLLGAEIIFSAAKDGNMPKFLCYENSNKVPVNALWLTNIMVQTFLIITLFSNGTYLILAKFSASMILVPYFLSAAFHLLLVIRGEGYENQYAERRKDFLIAMIGSFYAVWLLYAAGTVYLLFSVILYALGITLFAMARWEKGEGALKGYEIFGFISLLVLAALGIYGLSMGYLLLDL